MSVTDNSIIATAIPKITEEFHSLDDVGWYGSGMLRKGRLNDIC